MSFDLDHAGDVLSFVLARMERGERCALGVVTHTAGGGVRAPGALLAVAGDGTMAGYVSNGCVDADVAAQAVSAIGEGRPRSLRYGEGSPFRDVVLPCGGAMEVWIAPTPSQAAVSAASEATEGRARVALRFEASGAVSVGEGRAGDAYAASLTPRPRLRIVGRGAEPIALARAALAARYDVAIWSPDQATLQAAEAMGVREAAALQTPSRLPEAADDEWTAVILLFHDHDWELGLLEQALDGPAPYVGALGSRNAQARRAEALEAMGVPAEAVARVRGPVGLVPSLRDASAVAVSILAEVVDEARSWPR